MGPVSASVSIDAPRERVFAVIADLANRPAFCDHFMTDFHLLRLESGGVGAAARFRTAARGFPIWMETVITEIEAPHRLIERGRGSRADRMELGTGWELVEAPGATTELTVTFWADATNPVDAARSRLGARRWYRRQWRRALGRLQTLLEGDRAIEPLQVAGTSRI